MLGAVRAVAQSVSYEIRLSLIIIHILVFHYFELQKVKLTPLCVFLFLVLLLFLTSSLAETNRSPFDFSEGESELVRGFNTEFRSVSFVIIFLAEYLSILFMAVMLRALFHIRNITDLILFVLI